MGVYLRNVEKKLVRIWLVQISALSQNHYCTGFGKLFYLALQFSFVGGDNPALSHRNMVVNKYIRVYVVV